MSSQHNQKAVFKNANMSEEMQQDSVKCATRELKINGDRNYTFIKKSVFKYK
uniref:Uncharacterized protein n=1 Tax=Sus scrofa TaxID=9823 RepID=A0A8D1WL17_PIG